MITETQNFEAMSLCQIADKYKVSVYILRKWLSHFLPTLQFPGGAHIYTPIQVKQIIEACGEFPA